MSDKTEAALRTKVAHWRLIAARLEERVIDLTEQLEDPGPQRDVVADIEVTIQQLAMRFAGYETTEREDRLLSGLVDAFAVAGFVPNRVAVEAIRYLRSRQRA